MEISIVKIGKSKGIRIPKNIIDQFDIKDRIELEVHEKEIILKPLTHKPRDGWKDAFNDMHENKDDKLIIEDHESDEPFDWEW